MSAPLRKEVLKAFKNIHRARLDVFQGDASILKAARSKINEEFKKNKSIGEPEVIHEAIEFTNAVATELRKTVVQAKEKSPGLFHLRILPETEKLDNMPFDPNVEIPKKGLKLKRVLASPCCQDAQAQAVGKVS